MIKPRIVAMMAKPYLAITKMFRWFMGETVDLVSDRCEWFNWDNRFISVPDWIRQRAMDLFFKLGGN